MADNQMCSLEGLGNPYVCNICNRWKDVQKLDPYGLWFAGAALFSVGDISEELYFLSYMAVNQNLGK